MVPLWGRRRAGGGLDPEGSRKNKLVILVVEAPGRQGAKTQEYQDILSFRNAAGRDASASKMETYF